MGEALFLGGIGLAGFLISPPVGHSIHWRNITRKCPWSVVIIISWRSYYSLYIWNRTIWTDLSLWWPSFLASLTKLLWVSVRKSTRVRRHDPGPCRHGIRNSPELSIVTSFSHNFTSTPKSAAIYTQTWEQTQKHRYIPTCTRTQTVHSYVENMLTIVCHLYSQAVPHLKESLHSLLQYLFLISYQG